MCCSNLVFVTTETNFTDYVRIVKDFGENPTRNFLQTLSRSKTDVVANINILLNVATSRAFAPCSSFPRQSVGLPQHMLALSVEFRLNWL